MKINNPNRFNKLFVDYSKPKESGHNGTYQQHRFINIYGFKINVSIDMYDKKGSIAKLIQAEKSPYFKKWITI